MGRYKGIVFTALSAVLFGLAPLLAMASYSEGSNAVTYGLLRNGLSVPVLWLILRFQRIPMRVTPAELRHILPAGVVGVAGTALLLASSYTIVSGGLATTLHFIYPVLIAGACVALYRERMSLVKVLALACAVGGIVLCADTGSGQAGIWGVVMALASGATYAFYVVYIDKTGLARMHYFKLSLYICASAAAFFALVGAATGTLALNMSLKGWGLSFMLALMLSVAAQSLFQLGVRYIGASTAAILSTMEPLTSLVMGFLFQGEDMSWRKALSCGLILTAVVAIAVCQSKEYKEAQRPVELEA